MPVSVRRAAFGLFQHPTHLEDLHNHASCVGQRCRKERHKKGEVRSNTIGRQKTNTNTSADTTSGANTYVHSHRRPQAAPPRSPCSSRVLCGWHEASCRVTGRPWLSTTTSPTAHPPSISIRERFQQLLIHLIVTAAVCSLVAAYITDITITGHRNENFMKSSLLQIPFLCPTFGTKCGPNKNIDVYL